MSAAFQRDAAGRRLWLLSRPARAEPPSLEVPPPDWVQAQPGLIRAALEHALALPSGGWYVLDAAHAITDRPRAYTVLGAALVAWRDGEGIHVAPDACPHLGAPLSRGSVREGRLVCPWHGLALAPRGRGAWRPYAVHDDGVFAWVRPTSADPAVPSPVLAPRPADPLAVVVRRVARCEPRDVVANRLDPWHGVHYHPYAFARLRVLAYDHRGARLRVAYRVAGPLCVEVEASFHCPEPRTVVMTILDGEGQGSVVETHATPLGPSLTAITEATLVTSSRRGFRYVLRAATLVRPWIAHLARRLWVDDGAYAEQLQRLRDTPPRT